MKTKRERRIAMLLAALMLIINLGISPVWAAPGDVVINEDNFPDANFMEIVKTLDKDSNGKLSSEELAVTVFNVSKNNIKNLKGIEHFTKLNWLDCSENQLTALDLSKNINLETLHCYQNQLTTLNLMYNTKLTDLSCSENQLTTLDLSHNTELRYIYCDENQLTALDLMYNTKLTSLSCSENQLTALDLMYNTKLTGLSCGKNQLTALDLKNKTKLLSVDCRENQLTTLDLSKNTELKHIHCDGNQLTALNLMYNTKLTDLSCSENQLTNLDLKNNKNLKTLFCNQNQLANLDLSKNTKLTYINCVLNQLTTLDLSKKTNLETLYCGSNQLTALDLKDNTNLKTLGCGGNQFTALDLKNNTNLKTLDCQQNQLKTIDLSQNINLEDLRCYQNQLTALDLSKNKKLKRLKCDKNYLTNLDLSNNSKVYEFDGSDQEYDIKVSASTLKFDLKSLPGNFNSSMASDWDGGTVEGNILTLDDSSISKVKYNYNVNNGDKKINVTLNVKYGDVVTVTFNKNGHGGDPATIVKTIDKGSKVEKPNDPTDEQYDFGGWYTEAEGTNKFDFSQAVNDKITLYAKWTKKTPPTTQYTLTASVNGGHGSVSPESKTVNKDENITVTFAPAEGYEIDEVKVNGNATAVSDNTLTLTMNENKTVVVKYKEKPVTPPPTPITYTLTASVEGGNGNVSPTNETKNAGEKVTLTFTPDANYEIEEVKVNGTATTVSGNTLTLTMNENKTVVVKYKEKPVTPPPAPTQFTIKFEANGGSGSMADVKVDKDSNYSLPACKFTPPTDKEFKAWQVGGVEKNIGDEITVDGDKTVTAVWKDKGSVPPTPPVPPTPTPEPTPSPYPYPVPWIIYPSWYYAYETPEPKEEPVKIDRKIVLTIGMNEMDRGLNGISTDIMMDVAPYIKEGRTMLPVRYVAEGLGFDVKWIESTRTVVLLDGTTKVEIPVDTDKIIVNGTVYATDVKPEIKKGRTMLSIGNIARALGLQDGKDIIWNDKSKTVTIYRTILVK